MKLSLLSKLRPFGCYSQGGSETFPFLIYMKWLWLCLRFKSPYMWSGGGLGYMIREWPLIQLLSSASHCLVVVFLFCFFTPNAPNLTDRKLDNYQFCVPHQGTGNPEDIQPPCTHYSVWSHCHLREEPKQVSNMTAWGCMDIITLASQIQQVSVEEARNDEGTHIGNPTKLTVAMGFPQRTHC